MINNVNCEESIWIFREEMHFFNEWFLTFQLILLLGTLALEIAEVYNNHRTQHFNKH